MDNLRHSHSYSNTQQIDNKSYYYSELLFDSGKIREGKPLFTVCLSTYNFADSIILSLKTIVSQSMDDYEIVIQDDHSTDNTCEVILNFLTELKQSSAKRIRLYRSCKNCGILANRLRAFGHSEGKWLIQTDGDDFSPNDRIENTFRIIENLDHEPMLISTNRWNWKEGTPYETICQQSEVAPCFNKGWIKLIDIINQRNIPNGSSGFILNRKVFEKFYDSTPKERIIADDPVLARRALLLGDAYISDLPIYYCRVSINSASGQGVSGKKWILDRYYRFELLHQDIEHIREDHTVPSKIESDINKWKKRMLLDSKLIDCSNIKWPFLWVNMLFISPWEAKQALKKRIKLILFGSVNHSFRS